MVRNNQPEGRTFTALEIPSRVEECRPRSMSPKTHGWGTRPGYRLVSVNCCFSDSVPENMAPHRRHITNDFFPARSLSRIKTEATSPK
ncbi:MAG: hypothetical protein MI923_05020 [Phycisphaerales bacterium]|nr:hypothetical protein [Phycisphaerales bacterium]